MAHGAPIPQTSGMLTHKQTNKQTNGIENITLLVVFKKMRQEKISSKGKHGWIREAKSGEIVATREREHRGGTITGEERRMQGEE